MQTSIAKTQRDLTTAELQCVLALVRGRTLAAAGERLGLAASTVFRTLQKLERLLGRALFERGRDGYAPGELALALAEHAERVEAALDGARSLLATTPAQVAGTVRITTTDTVLHALVAPALRSLHATHPLLDFELHTGNELANLTRRDADIAVRATRRPPQHLVGRCLGPLKVAVYAARGRGAPDWEAVQRGEAEWIAPDDALPDHPSVQWRRKQLPRVQPRYRVSSVQSVLELVAQGLGVGIVPLFLAESRRDVVRLTEPLEACTTDLWLLTHPESRHLRRIAVVYAHLSEAVALP